MLTYVSVDMDPGFVNIYRFMMDHSSSENKPESQPHFFLCLKSGRILYAKVGGCNSYAFSIRNILSGALSWVSDNREICKTNVVAAAHWDNPSIVYYSEVRWVSLVMEPDD